MVVLKAVTAASSAEVGFFVGNTPSAAIPAVVGLFGWEACPPPWGAVDPLRRATPSNTPHNQADPAPGKVLESQGVKEQLERGCSHLGGGICSLQCNWVHACVAFQVMLP
jgi:hypothetical protein